MYVDLSGSADARGRLDEVSPLSPILEALGFERVGLVSAEKAGAVGEVWRSPEQDAFAEPEWHPGRKPSLVFRTLLADGTIVQTSQPRHGWLRFVPLWPRQHHPAVGYLLEEAELPPHELWLRHRARVAELRASSGPPPPHGSMETFLGLARRSVQVTRFRTRFAQLVGLLIFLPIAAAVTVARAPSWALALTGLVWWVATWGAFRLALALPWPRRPAAG